MTKNMVQIIHEIHTDEVLLVLKVNNLHSFPTYLSEFC